MITDTMIIITTTTIIIITTMAWAWEASSACSCVFLRPRSAFVLGVFMSIRSAENFAIEISYLAIN